ncbi:hypothetical protein EI94DRAFT_1913870 [Lactarius quietus]|nr:hypothetical protein EI94DRAFT_1913870 [Lactarius quietus]
MRKLVFFLPCCNVGVHRIDEGFLTYPVNRVSLTSSTHTVDTAHWLVELHEKLWGKKELEDQIIRTVALNVADYFCLQGDLDGRNPTRGSDEYQPEDVLSVKVNFLRSKQNVTSSAFPQQAVHSNPNPTASSGSTISPSILADDADVDDLVDLPEITVDGDEEAEVLGSIFPQQIHYLDLTTLNLKKSWKARGLPLVMLIRSEWETLLDSFSKRERGRDGSVFLTGQPGIGKTCFLYYVLVTRLLRAQPTIFQHMDGRVFVVTDEVRLRRPADTIDGDDVVALVDGDRQNCIPDPFIVGNENHRILLTSSPKTRKDRSWIEQLCPATSQLPTTNPLHRLFILKNDVPLERIYDAVAICGSVPRRAYIAALSSQNLYDAKVDTRSAIKEIEDVAKIMGSVHVDGLFPHKVFEIYPHPDSNRFSGCLVRPVSQWAFDELFQELEVRNAHAARTFYNQIQATPNAATLRGMLWERQVHKYFRSLQPKTETFTFQANSLDNRNDKRLIKLSDATVHKDFGPIQDFRGYLKSSVVNRTSCYLKPIAGNFASVDAVLYDAVAGDLLGLQMTESLHHPISITGLAAIQTELTPGDRTLKDLRPTVCKKWNIIFVVPKPMGASYPKQGFKEKGKPVKKTSWQSKTKQYVLELDKKVVWDVL